MKSHPKTLQIGPGTCALAMPPSGRKPLSPPLKQLLWLAALALPAFCAQAGAVLTSLHSFKASDGAYPQAGLVQGSDGNFYGTTYTGGVNGINGDGTVFRISPGGVFTNLVLFNTTDGAAPEAGLVQGSNGLFYGTTASGGTNAHGYGTVFQVGSNGPVASLYSFGGTQDAFGVPLDGGVPEAPLVQASNGVFYGTCSYGGTNDTLPYGTIFQISTNGPPTIAWSFTGGTDGSAPEAGLVRAADGNYYGTTFGSGGAYGGVFKFTPPSSVMGLYSFTGGNDGANPFGGLVQGTNGYLYGTTSSGGAYTNGTVFRISTGGAITNLYSFTGGVDGAKPYGVLIQASDGYFYGTTTSGGTYTNGTVFRISAGGALSNLYSFTGGVDGAKPYGGVVQGTNGFFYGTTLMGGTNHYGTIFRLGVGPEFQSATLSNRTLILTWDAEQGGMYQLQYVPDLDSTNWTNLGSPLTAAGATLSTTDSVTNGPQRFYRLTLLP